MIKSLLPIFLLSIMANAQNKTDFLTPYEKGNGNQTATYEETIAYFQLLDKSFETVSMQEMGLTDSGEPLHIVTFNPDKDFDFEKIQKEKAVLLINNGIHPGEPDGIDATMMLFRDLALGKIKVPKNVVIVNIPIYNIGGALNRNSFSRANQNGPESYGFRGNARNYDLNRDFLKSDTRNARSFAQIFHKVNPDIFIDNHVSNGADYQYVFTYIATHPQKIGGNLGKFWESEMLPSLLSDLKKKKIESVPYVNIHDEKPDNGFEAFMDYPRYSTGFASMFNTIGSMPETHMLKEYASRVKVTYEYMISSIEYADKNYRKIKDLRKENLQNYRPGQNYILLWELDADKVSSIPFLGYEGDYKPSDISGKPRLFYDETKPFSKTIPYYRDYKPSLEVLIPEAYIVPKSWWNVIELLKINNIQMTPLEKDTELEVESYRIKDFKTSSSAYEGHYPHNSVNMTSTKKKVLFRKGDFLIKTQQPGVKYLLETLEPQANDSYFVWNFFDSILQQKEYFSAYVFEDLAKQLLEKNPKLKSEFEKKKAEDPKFADSGEAQLDWIYRHSDYYEKSHMEYPVFRIMK
ncbi:M14 family metallopeptidase [Flavobacterium sp. WW92]|uniref:M14 family metallopeptidase n=1 Tax=unclassified Flavobacterium TaxID=196869 RepID=UPI0022248239|nr:MULTISPECIES: M14 family metallopeptidase [unclassified Flavobacterium]WDO11424.1 M14 family metallopeptidase [Flavobacterium sp. WW92]